MTRLREALEKAVSQSAVEQTEPSAGTPQFADPAQLVPDAWDLDGVEEAVQATDHLLRPPLAADVAVEAPRDSARPAKGKLPTTDVWATYQFGSESSTKLVVGPEPNSALVEQYRRLGAALHHHQLERLPAEVVAVGDAEARDDGAHVESGRGVLHDGLGRDLADRVRLETGRPVAVTQWC